MINELKKLGKVRVSKLTPIQLSGLPEVLRKMYSIANGIQFSEPFDLEIMSLSRMTTFQSDEWLDLCSAWISAVPFASASRLRSFVAVATLNGASIIVHIDADDAVIRPIADSLPQFLELLSIAKTGEKSPERWPSAQLYSGAQLLDHFDLRDVEIGLASRYARSISAFQMARVRCLDFDVVQMIIEYGNEDLIEAMLLELRRRGEVTSEISVLLRSLLRHTNNNISLDARLIIEIG